MSKVIITCCCNDPLGRRGSHTEYSYPAVPKTVEQIVDSVYESYKAGASVVHLHPLVKYTERDTPSIDVESWTNLVKPIREKCKGMVVQFGVAGANIEDRIRVLESSEKPDMMSVCLTEHDYNFDNGVELNIMHPRAELEEYVKICSKYQVKPELEVFHLGALFNLKWLEAKGLSMKPHWLTLFFGAKGGIWTPPTADEVLHRIRNLPEGVLFQSSLWGGVRGTASPSTQTSLLTLTMLNGGHVRLGTEDNPYFLDDQPAQSNAQIVGRIATVAREIGRGVATPEETRKMMGLTPS